MTGIGDRVRMVHCDDPYVTIPPGTLGTVTDVDDAGTVFVDWDDGHRLGMIREAGDVIEPVGKEEDHGKGDSVDAAVAADDTDETAAAEPA